MSNLSIDARTLKLMFLSGAKNLEQNKEWINDLNVFPVPDGDTGTNMTLTVLSAVKEVQNAPEVSLEALAKAISSGSLRGARGNSGVIMSQLFRGFTKEMKEHDVLDMAALSAAMTRATETAYKAVMKPKEGTILTVARGMSEKAEELLADSSISLEDFAKSIIEAGDETLEKTPELLPVLKQAGVVDSGGQGLMQFLKGAILVLNGEADSDIESFMGGASSKASPASGNSGSNAGAGKMASSEDLGDIKFGYCTEFLVNVERHYDDIEEVSFKAYLESIGDCVVVVSDDDIIKVHVHTNNPGLAIQKGLSYGNLTSMKIDNMRVEHEEKLIREASKIAAEAKAEETEQEQEPQEHKDYGFISICAGAGLVDVFKELGVDQVIEGGQTMNPSTDDIVSAAEKINADTIFVFPNNKNIILASEQAVSLVEDKKLVVIPTTSVPECVTSIISFDPEASVEENAEAMKEAFSIVKTGQVTYAVRDTNIDGTEIHENDIMGIGGSGLLAIGHDINRVSRDMTSAMVDEDSALISIYYGEDISEEEAQNLAEDIEAAHPDLDVQLNFGGQPVYYYIISVE